MIYGFYDESDKVGAIKKIKEAAYRGFTLTSSRVATAEENNLISAQYGEVFSFNRIK